MLRARLAALLTGTLALLICLFTPLPARAEPGDELTVYVITFGPGDHPFFKFGHDAIWIHNAAAPPGNPLKRDPVYNFGTFAFGDPALIPKFVQGRFMYWLSKQSIGATVQIYQRENRSVEAQELNLTAAQKRALFDALEENAKEENMYYKYDYYRDNCATRVRDAIDRAIDGKLKEASQDPASMTWREHTLRLTADDKVLSLALTVVMGNVIDRKLNQWDEMFLPAYVQQGLRRVKVKGPNGNEVPLVKNERVLTAAHGRAPLRTEPPSWGIWTLMAGLVFGGAMFGTGLQAKKSLPARIGLGVLLFIAGFLSILGALFVLVWIGTDHEVGWHNENILQLFPLCVALMGFAFGVMRLKVQSVTRARKVVLWALCASAFGLVWKVLPWMRQSNYWIIAFCLPMWGGALLGLRALEEAMRASMAPLMKPLPGKSKKKGSEKKKTAAAEEEGEEFLEAERDSERAPEEAEKESSADKRDSSPDRTE